MGAAGRCFPCGLSQGFLGDTDGVLPFLCTEHGSVLAMVAKEDERKTPVVFLDEGIDSQSQFG
jgi:hypothetical protein